METYYLAVDIGASSGKMELGWMENGKLCLEEVWRFPNGAKKKNGRRCWDTDALFSEIKATAPLCRDRQDSVEYGRGYLGRRFRAFG